jgi:hypothetical protein
LTEGDRRRNVMFVLLVFIVVLAALSWYLNPVSQQDTIGILLSAELVAFSMVLYAYTRHTDNELSELWMLVGASTIAVLLGLALL